MSLALSLVFAVVTLMLFMVPETHRPVGWNLRGALVPTLPLSLFQFFLYLYSFLARSKAGFLAALSMLLTSTAIASPLLAIRVHGDFMKAPFFSIAGMYVLVAYRIELFGSDRKRFLHALTTVAEIGVALSCAWIFVIAYAAVVELHPERTKFIFMNIYATIVCSIVVAAIFRARAAKRRRLEIGEDRLFVDEFDFSGFFGDNDLGMLAAILEKGGSATCADIASRLAGKPRDSSESPDWVAWDCETCKRESFTASRCPKYKNIYNRILVVRKLFEALRIGTVVAPENKLRIRDEGWRIRFAKDVEVGASK